MQRTDGKSQPARLGTPGWQAAIAPLLPLAECLPVALGLFLTWRRLIGAIDSPLLPLPLAGTAIGLLAWTIVLVSVGGLNDASRVSQLGGSGRFRLPRRTKWQPTATMLLFAVACSYPFSRVVDWAIWLPAFGLTIWFSRTAAWFAVMNRRERRASRAVRTVDSMPNDKGGEVIQQITRVRTTRGQEAIRAALSANFATGERSTILHVVFCPPFEQLPTVEAHVADDSPASVKVTQRLHQGAQLEVRLAKCAEDDVKVHVEMYAAETNSD